MNNFSSKFVGKKILVTGAQGSLGSFVVKKFLDAGHSVIGVDLKVPEASNNPALRFISVNLGDAHAVRESGLGQLGADVLIHCAGGFRFAPVDQISDEDLDFLINSNLRSALYLLRELIPGMKQRKFGRVVLISARASLQAGAGVGVYAGTKAALNSITQSLAEEGRPHNVHVNTLLPSIIDNPANRRDMPDADFSKWVHPEQLAEMIYSIVSPWGDAMNGSLTTVAGGL